jgi:5-methylcytosine-specific restriction endonuclease McrA
MFEDNESSVHIKREKAKARLLRKSSWWQKKLAKALCYYCQEPLEPATATMDHIVPLSRGGYSSKGNIATSCKTCNTNKKNYCPSEWQDYLLHLK